MSFLRKTTTHTGPATAATIGRVAGEGKQTDWPINVRINCKLIKVKCDHKTVDRNWWNNRSFMIL